MRAVVFISSELQLGKNREQGVKGHVQKLTQSHVVLLTAPGVQSAESTYHSERRAWFSG